MDKFDIEFKQLMLDSSKKFKVCCKHWDDIHPNIQGYQQLTDVLVKYL
jgi:lysophospholipase L1-like esterase